RILAWNRSQRTVEGVEFVDFDALVDASDIVSLHTALTAETQGMVGRSQLSQMKDGAYIRTTRVFTRDDVRRNRRYIILHTPSSRTK
ncbi:hypothetical protein N9334_04510, partial [Luminiphilus sp.]|nr:hypothetical protein [Luminiphilus sp.]